MLYGVKPNSHISGLMVCPPHPSSCLNNQTPPLLQEVLHSFLAWQTAFQHIVSKEKKMFSGNLIPLPIGCFFVDKNTSLTTAWAAPNRGDYRESLLIIVVLSPRSLFLWRRRIGWSVGRTKCQMLAGECVHLLLAVSLHVLLDQKCSPYLNQAVLVTTNQTFHHEDREETVATDI